jgi:hypothetical protein
MKPQAYFILKDLVFFEKDVRLHFESGPRYEDETA